MNITDEAVEAAAKAMYEAATKAYWEGSLAKRVWREEARVALEAAAPFIAARAMHAAAGYLEGITGPRAEASKHAALTVRIIANDAGRAR